MISDENRIQISSQFDMEEVFMGNTGIIFKITDKENGEEYLFKPSVTKGGQYAPYRAYIQEAACLIQKIINPNNAVQCNTITINGTFGSIQPLIDVDQNATREFRTFFSSNYGQLSEEIISQIFDEYLVDLCLCNYDSHERNFIIDVNGNLRGVDKEQSFRYLKRDLDCDMTFFINYNAGYGEHPSIYKKIIEQISEGKISIAYIDRLKDKAKALESISDEDYIEIFREYAYNVSRTSKEAQILLNQILDRKKGLVKNIEQLYQDLMSERASKGIIDGTSSIEDINDETESIEVKNIVPYGVVGEPENLSICSRMVKEFEECDLIKTTDEKILLRIKNDDGSITLINLNENTMINDVEKIILNLQLAREHGNVNFTSENNEPVEYKDEFDGIQEGDQYLRRIENITQEMCNQIGIYDEEIIEFTYDYLVDYLETVDDIETAFKLAIKNAFLNTEVKYDIDSEKAKNLAPYFQKLKDITELNGKCTISDVDQLLINGLPLDNIERIREELISKAIIDNRLVDLRQYPDSIQVSLMHTLFDIETLQLDEADTEALKSYKLEHFKDINNFMRGNFSELEQDDSSDFSIIDYVDTILRINNIAQKMPKRDYDIVLGRFGQGNHSEQEYESFVSFGTNGGTIMGGDMPRVRYIMELKKDDPAIPLELFCENLILTHLPECEVTTLPFRYDTKEPENENESNLQTIEMENIELISVEEILIKRLQQLKDERGESSEIDEALQLVYSNIESEKSEDMAKPDSEDLISQVVENPNNNRQPTFSSIKRVANQVHESFKRFWQKENGNER